MTHFSLPQLPETQQRLRKHSKQSYRCQTPKHWRPFQYFTGKFLGTRPSFSLCFKGSSNKSSYLVFLPKQLEKWIRMEETPKGRYTQSGLSEGENTGGYLCKKKVNIRNHSSLRPFSLSRQNLSSPGHLQRQLGTKETCLVCSLIYILNDSIWKKNG